MPSRRAGRSLAGLALTAALLVALLAAAPGAAAAPKVDWSTYGFDHYRTGYNPDETTLGVGNVGGLHKLWSFRMSSVTIMQPALAAGVMVQGSPTDIVYTGSEHGDFYALNASDGTVVWQKNLGSEDTGCFDMPDGIFGTSGAPSLDRANHRLFVVGGDGKVHSLDLATGIESPGWPVTVTNHPDHEHTYGGVNVVHGKMWIEVASYCDFTPYHGKIVPVDVATHTRGRAWYPATKTVNGGGVWGPGGVAVDPTNGHVFAATGNALTNPESFHYSENVVELAPAGLKVLGANYPGLTGGDVDFGATPVLYQPAGCPPMVAAKNKSGVLVTYVRGDISAGPTQRLQVASVSDWQFNGIPAWDPATNTMYIGNSSSSGSFHQGMVALAAQPDCSLALAWQQNLSLGYTISMSPPTVANGVVYYGDGTGNQEFAFNSDTGQPLWNSGSTIGGALFGAPIVVNGRLYVGSWDQMFYAFGP